MGKRRVVPGQFPMLEVRFPPTPLLFLTFIKSVSILFSMKSNYGICATLTRRTKHGLKRLVFETNQQDHVETTMAQLGFGCNQYWLSPAPLRKDVKLLLK